MKLTKFEKNKRYDIYWIMGDKPMIILDVAIRGRRAFTPIDDDETTGTEFLELVDAMDRVTLLDSDTVVLLCEAGKQPEIRPY